MARLLLACLAAPALLAQAPAPKADPLAPLRFLIGEWQGVASGQPGEGTALRSYETILKDRFIQERNTSTYPPQARNKAGEMHEHQSLFSYDGARKAILFRQFHQEGFVITYALNPSLSTTSRLVFDSEQVENVPRTWRARETYDLVSADEFTETFELAQGDKPYAVYSRNRFTRRKP